MNWAYALLGIPADADATTIKRAYARLLRTTRPDDDAAAFQRLNTAYQLALSQTGNRSAAPVTAPTIVVHPSGEPVSVSEPAARPRSTPASQPEVQQPSASPAPAPLEVLKPSTPPSPLAPRPLETLRSSEAGKPAPTPAPLEILKPAASAPKPAARPIEVLRPPAPKPAPAINTKELAERAIREASTAEEPQTLSRWLNHLPEFWSLQVKQVTGQLLLQRLLREPQPMTTANLDVLLRFFDLDHVLSGVNPVALEQLRNKQAVRWEMLHDQASLARRARILTQKGRPHTLRVRDCIKLLGQPRNWRQTFITALTRGKSLHLARMVYALCNGQVEQLPPALDREHARFWLRAADVSGINRERTTISAFRALCFALVCAGMTVPMMLLSTQSGSTPLEVWKGVGGVFFVLFAGILLIWATFTGAVWIDQWQGQPEAMESPKPWLRRLFIPLLSALGLCLDYLGGAPIAASIIVWGLMILSIRRFTHRQPRRTNKPRLNLSPRAVIYLLAVGTIAMGNLVQQIPGGAFDDIPLLGVASGATLFVWSIDMWRHRAFLHPKLART